ncbi:Uncharacterised protein [uncultured archaeon]|nr:Uncharacterised protein [uncultured archaeon]
MASNLPSSFSRQSGEDTTPRPSQSGTAPKAPSLPSESSLPLYLGILALVIALASFYGTFFVDKPLSFQQKAEIAGIADSLRALQARDITLSAPMQTTVELNKSYPIKDLFPATFEIPLNFVIPLDTQLIAVGASGQPVSFRVQEEVPISAVIPINSADAFGNETIRIQKTMPVEAKFSSSVKIRAAYGDEFNSIIDRLDKLAGRSSG